MDAMLRKALRRHRELRTQFENCLLGDDGDMWETEARRFLAKRPCWITGQTTPVVKPIHLLPLLTTAKFDLVSPNITPANFPAEPIRSQDYKVFDFGRSISSEDAVAQMAKDGYLPTNIYEDLSWTGWNGTDIIVSLGSSCVLDRRRHVPRRGRIGAERRLDLFDWDGGWPASYRFLAVRNPQPLVS